ncbi:hypothetical protein LguiB_028951 [Lonicera macranthoides]
MVSFFLFFFLLKRQQLCFLRAISQLFSFFFFHSFASRNRMEKYFSKVGVSSTSRNVGSNSTPNVDFTRNQL